MMVPFNPAKFSLAELTSNTNGKTSGSGTVGVFAGLSAVWVFLIGVTAGIFVPEIRPFVTEVLPYVITILTIASALLGYRKSQDSVTSNITDTTEVIDKPLNS
jgi:hypothetical protein